MSSRAKPSRPLPLVATAGDVDSNGDLVDVRPLLDDELKARLGRAIVAANSKLKRDQLRAVGELLGRRIA